MPLFQFNSLSSPFVVSRTFFFGLLMAKFCYLQFTHYCLAFVFSLIVSSFTVSLFLLATKQLSPNAIKDYNRGRAYLADLANSSGVAELFTSVKEAVTQYIKLQSSNNSSSLSSSLLSTSLSLSSSMSSPSQTNAWHELQCRQGRGIGSNHQF